MQRVLLFIGLFISVSAFSQSNKADSIRNVIRTTRNDSVKTQALIWLASIYQNENPDTALIVSRQAQELAIKLGNIISIARAQHIIGWCYYFKSNYPKALELYFNSIGLLEKSEKNAGSASGKLIALERSKIYNDIGNVYYTKGESDKALVNYTKGLEVAEAFELKEQIVAAIGNLGLLYDQKGNIKKAMAYYNRALKLNEEMGNKKGLANNLTNIGGLYYTDKKFDLAISYYTKSMKIFEEIDYKYGVAINLSNLGFIYNEQAQLPKAQQAFERALQLVTEIKNLEEIKSLNSFLSSICEHQGQIENALKYYKAYSAAKDSLLNEENTKKTVKLEMQFEFDKKEAVTKLEQEKKEAVSAAESKKQRMVIYTVCGVLLLVIGFAIFAYRSFLQKRRDNIAITEQKQIIAEKQKEILDSIKYAKRIQTAHMPTEKYVDKNIDRLKNKI